MSQVGDRLKALRQRRHLSQEQVARRADLTLNTVVRVELGYVSPRRGTVIKLARGLGVPLSDLVDDENDDEPTPAATA